MRKLTCQLEFLKLNRIVHCAHIFFLTNTFFFYTDVSFLHPKFTFVMAVREFDFSNLLIRPTGISGLVGGGISPGSRFLTLNRDLLISLSLCLIFSSKEISLEMVASEVSNSESISDPFAVSLALKMRRKKGKSMMNKKHLKKANWCLYT